MKIGPHILSLLLCSILLLNISCINGAGSGKRTHAVDYSITNTTETVGCGTDSYIEFSSDQKSYTCGGTCASGTHTATTTETNNFNSTSSDLLISLLKGSAGLCVSDSAAARPSGEVYISPNYCSCIKGKADIINDCDSYCAGLASSDAPILHVSTTLGPSIVNNTKLGSLYNWCYAQLDGDIGKPACTLSAWDGTNTIDNIPVTVPTSGNGFTADITALAPNTTYVIKLVESKTGSNAASAEFQIRRVKQSTTTDPTQGALKISPISQYTCLTYGGLSDPNGTITRTNYARVYYYFPANEIPAPVPSPGGTNQQVIVCHDEINNPGYDQSLYPRLELIPAQFTMWDKTEARFVKTNNVMAINTVIQNRLSDEYGITSTVDLFTLINYPNRPSIGINGQPGSTNTSVAQGFMMVPFINSSTNKAYCPVTANFNSSDSLFRILKDYIGNTEGLYLGEKEAETIQDGTNGYKNIYGTMFTTETILKNYGFYVQNGLKVKATAATLHNNTIYYYWPVNPTMDPLQQGDRRLFTVRFYDQLNGNTPTGVSNSVRPSDKRIGCVPITAN